jgi:hypothetical protein
MRKCSENAKNVLTNSKKNAAKPLKKIIFLRGHPAMAEYFDSVKITLDFLINQMSENTNEFVKNPGKDFTRKRKLPFVDIVKLIITMGGNSIYKELLEATGYDENTATTSAFTQQRDKILPKAFEELFRKFTNEHRGCGEYNGYRIYAVDGSDLHIPTNATDKKTHSSSNPNGAGHNLVHLNALYDLQNRLYVDALIQPDKEKNEHKALLEMINRTDCDGCDNTIVICDRNYESYNAVATITQKGWNFLIRAKDIDSNGILSRSKNLKNDEFDTVIKFTLTKSATKEIKANPDVYRIIPHNTTFDFLDADNKFYDISFRAVRIKLENGTFETVITNLSENEFPPTEIKKLYTLRWGIETSFRELKYSVGLLNFHSKKYNHIEQEIFAKLIMHNFSEILIIAVVVEKIATKHLYQVNFTIAINVCRLFLRQKNILTADSVFSIILKNTLPVRPNRKSKRKPRFKRAVSFLYRVACHI